MKQFFSKLRFRTKQNSTPQAEPIRPPLPDERAQWDRQLVFSLAKKRFPTWEQLQYVPEYLSKRERLIIRLCTGIIILGVAFLFFSFYQRHVVYLPESGGEYSEALIGQPTYVNPILAQSDVDRDLSKLLYSGLFRFDEQLELQPDLAESYTLSEDKKVYTVVLREGLTWHNGNALLADDVVFTFQLITDPDFSSPLYSTFRGVTVDRIDDRTVTFTLPEPFAPFLSNLTVGILPMHVWGDVQPANFRLAEFNTRPIGSGPYKFSELTKEQSGTIRTYLLIRNDSYYTAAPFIDQLLFKFYPDFETALTALKNGNTDGISYIPKDYRDSFAESKHVEIHHLQLPQYTAVFFNQKNDIFKNENVTKALSLATDKNRILTEALNNQGTIVSAPILEGFLGYNPTIERFDYNAERAAAVLEEQGWKVPEGGGLRQKNGAELKFSLTTVDQPEYLKTADILRENWEAVGVGVELKIMNPNRVDKEVIKPRNYEAFLYGEILGTDPDPYPFWHSSQSLNGGLNLANYFNKEADKLLEEARKTDNPDERAQKYIEFQNILIADMPAVFLFSPSYDYPVNRSIHGIGAARITVPSDRLNGITNWYIKTRLGWE
ncbi:MAG: hypothetical protein HZC01_03020 [Candidatus Kerfeldbacteria bacterium]|nr:hypothetical protein [Candidatus Kerfeldbacteria bacterium]